MQTAFHSPSHPGATASHRPASLLTLDLSSYVGHPCHLSLSHWSEGVSWSISNGGEVHKYPVYCSPGIPFTLVAHLQEAADWSADIPAAIRAGLIRHQPLYAEATFTALWYLSRSLEARELFDSQPVLFCLVIRQAARDRLDPGETMALFSRKRIELLAYAGFEPLPSLLRLMGRIDTTRFAANELVYLSIITQLPGWQRLNHLRRIDGMLLYHIINDAGLLEARFLTRMDEQWSWVRFKYLRGEIRHMIRGIGDRDQRILRCASMAAIEALHDRLSTELQRQEIEEIPDMSYPPPPLQGTDIISPVTDARSLAREGQEMRNCVYSRHDAVMNGRYYVYRVMGPERATLGVSVTPDGQTKIDELRLVCNGIPDHPTWTAVETWWAFTARALQSGGRISP